MFELPLTHKRVLDYICGATRNERYMRGCDLYREALHDWSFIEIGTVMAATNELVFLGMVRKVYSEQWQADTYHATEMGFSYNRGSVMDREEK